VDGRKAINHVKYFYHDRMGFFDHSTHVTLAAIRSCLRNHPQVYLLVICDISFARPLLTWR
jgi:hypothetical protein